MGKIGQLTAIAGAMAATPVFAGDYADGYGETPK